MSIATDTPPVVALEVLRAKLDAARELARAELQAPADPQPLPYALEPALEPSAIAGFQAEHGVTLPDDYTRFLMSLGNGGAGPAHYGTYSLELAGSESRKTIYTLADVFVPPINVNHFVAEQAPGMLLVGYNGCAYYDGLVLTGPEAGSMWTYVDTGPGWIPIGDDAIPLVDGNGDPYEFHDGNYTEWYAMMLLPENRGRRVSFTRYYEQWLDGLLAMAADADSSQ